MNNELKRAFEYLAQRHRIMKEFIALEEEHDASFTRGYTAGIKSAVLHYGEEIENINRMLEGYIVDDLTIEEDDEICLSTL